MNIFHAVGHPFRPVLLSVVLPLGLFLLSGLFLTSCQPLTPAAATPSLYDHLGGMDGLTEFTDHVIQTLATDGRLQAYFVMIDHDTFRAHLLDQFCVFANGPCHYTGRSMTDTHRGWEITPYEFNAFLDDIQDVLNLHDIPRDTQTPFLAQLRALQAAIVPSPALLRHSAR